MPRKRTVVRLLDDDFATLAEHRDELAALLPLLSLRRFDRRGLNRALAGLSTASRGEHGMKVMVQVVLQADDDAGAAPSVVREVFCLDREALAPDTVGLQLSEAKDLLAAVQDALVDAQVTAAVAAQAGCPRCGKPRRHKDQRPIVVRSLFGTLRLLRDRDRIS